MAITSRLVEIDAEADIRCFLLVLPLEENLRRIRRRQTVRAIDELEFEEHTVMQERAALFQTGSDDLGRPFDVSAAPEQLVAELLLELGMPTS